MIASRRLARIRDFRVLIPMGIVRSVLISVLAVLFARLASGQDTLRTQTNVVLVPALVKDGAGNVVYGLQAKDFIIEDDAVIQPVRMDEAAVAEPESLGIAIQTGRTAPPTLHPTPTSTTPPTTVPHPTSLR